MSKQCAVLMRAGTTKWASHCDRLPAMEARWRFEEGVTRLRWCAGHASVLMRRDRCVAVRPLELTGVRYDADIDDGRPTGTG